MDKAFFHASGKLAKLRKKPYCKWAIVLVNSKQSSTRSISLSLKDDEAPLIVTPLVIFEPRNLESNSLQASQDPKDVIEQLNKKFSDQKIWFRLMSGRKSKTSSRSSGIIGKLVTC